MATEEEVLTLGIDLDIKSTLAQLNNFERQMKKSLAEVTKQVSKMGGANTKINKAATASTDKWREAVEDLSDSSEGHQRTLGKMAKTAKATGVAEAKAAKKSIDTIHKELQRKGKGNLVDTKQLASDMKAGFSDALGDFKSATSSFFSKDLKGMVGSLGAGLGKALSGGAKGVKFLTGKFKNRGKDKKDESGLMKKNPATQMAPLLKILGKIGPIIASAGAVFMGLIKLFIDAEAQAKDFNKQILQSASTAEFLAASGGDAGAAFTDLKGTMKELRSAAYSLDNLEWGISSEEHKQVLNVLNQEGVSIRRIKQEAATAGKSVSEFATDLTHTSVAYSRAFGVPLQQINELQAEMMTEMGMNLGTTQLAFEQMNRGATESGIASNKFFAIIRGVSQDLSLYNMRIEQSVKLLTMLGKVMNPRDAQKFMQGVIGTFKNMSQDDRLKVAILAGDKGRQILDKDLKGKREMLYKDVAAALGKGDEAGAAEVKKRFESGGAKGVWDDVAEADKSKLGTLRGSERTLRLDEAASKKGDYGRGVAMANLGVGASLDMMKAAFAGGGDLSSRVGDIGMHKMAENQGVSTDQLRGFMALEQAVKDKTDELVKEGKVTRKQVASGEVTTQNILDTMTAEEQKALKDGTKSSQDFAKEQGELTTSLITQLGVLTDFMMNQAYDAFMGIWEAVTSLNIFEGNTEALDKARAEKALLGSGSGELRSLTGKKGSVKDLKEGVLGSGTVKDIFNMFSGGATGTASGQREEELYLQKRIDEQISGAAPEGAPQDVLADPKKHASYIAAEINKTMLTLQKMSLESNQATDVISKSINWKDVYSTEASLLQAGVEPLKARNTSVALGTASDSERAGVMEAQGISGGQQAQFFKSMMAKMDISTLMDVVAETAPSEEAAEAAVSTEKLTQQSVANTAPLLNHNTISVKFSKAGLRAVEGVLDSSILKGVGQALWEYYLYSEEEDRESLLKRMEDKGIDPTELRKQLREGNTTLAGVVGGAAAEEGEGGNALGGVVTGVSNGLANVRAAAGEGLTSIGAGEVIVPKGGSLGSSRGGGTTRVEVSVKQGFEQFIETKVIEGIQDFRRREKFN